MSQEATPKILREVSRERWPHHIAIIMDGNGRWAQQRDLPRVEGHRAGVSSVRKITEECARLDIEQLTLYCLSSENWKRPEEELDFLMQLLHKHMIEERDKIMQENVRVTIIGRRDKLPENVLREVDRTIEMSRDNTGLRVCLAINYGGRSELVDAARRIAEEVEAGTLRPEEVKPQLGPALNNLVAQLGEEGESHPDIPPMLRRSMESQV